MAKKRAKFFETRTFGFVIAAAVIAVILALSYGTGLLQVLELKANDANFRLKDFTERQDCPGRFRILREGPANL